MCNLSAVSSPRLAAPANQCTNSGSQVSHAQRYEPKNILITGGCGFIASHVVNYFVVRYPQCKVVNLDCLDYCASQQNVCEVEKLENYVFVHGDIRNVSLVEQIFHDHAIDTVLHFAALSHVDLSFTDCGPAFMDVNVVGTHVVLEAARKHGVSRFIHVSTDEVYGETGSNRVTEEAPLRPTNPYSRTKAAAEMLAKAYISTHGMPIIITRGNNVYGPHQYPEKLIPKFICRLLRGQSCCLHGDGSTKRNFMYVDDAVRAFDIVLHFGALHEVYNIGCNEEFSVRDVAELLIRELRPFKRESPSSSPQKGDDGRREEEKGGKSEGQESDDDDDVGKWMECVKDRKHNDNNYRIDFRKLSALGWRPLTRFEDGVKQTIEWYKHIRPSLDAYWTNFGDVNPLTPHPITTSHNNHQTTTTNKNNDPDKNNNTNNDNKGTAKVPIVQKLSLSAAVVDQKERNSLSSRMKNKIISVANPNPQNFQRWLSFL